VPKFPQSSL